MLAQSERVFSEPWQAQVFALAMNLAEAGHFTWTEWSQQFGAHLKAAAAAKGVSDDDTPMPAVDSPEYYAVWLDALESLLIQRGLASADDLAALKQAWTEAYLCTPHGKPVVLGGERDQGHDHSYGHDHGDAPR
jgi:nitrile hydratase accessory protein